MEKNLVASNFVMECKPKHVKFQNEKGVEF